MFEPIAVVGRGCVLPGALTPDALWANILAKRVSVGPVPDGRWRLGRPLAGEPFPAHSGESGVPGTGGYVDGFGSVWVPEGFCTVPADIGSLDPLFHWAMHCGREALREAGLTGPLPRAGLVLGVLGYPSPGMSRFAEQTWARELPGRLRQAVAGHDAADPRNRFSCGLAAHLTARALGLGGDSLALDAACASSLYAIKIAADRLQDGTADVMLAAAVNRADDLFLHAAFGALGAISRTGQSRPFARTADGLVPAEGAACVALVRLADAIRTGMPVLAVIRGIGLSNGGRGQGLLAPSPEGQERALLGAYQAAGLDPGSVSLLECHATGTGLGDAAEVRTAAKVFAAVRDLPVGSVKSNLGHPMPVAGLAALLKVVGAMHAGIRPATLGAEDPTDALTGTTLRPLTEHEAWDGHRRAGLSTFGFGGNNAHLVLDALPPATTAAAAAPHSSGSDAAEAGDGEVAIVAIGARVGTGRSVRDFTGELLGDPPAATRRQTVVTPLEGLRFPPADLKYALPQQLLLLEAVREATSGQNLPRERTTVLIGMGCDPESVRYLARWRVPSWLAESGAAEAAVHDPAARDAFAPPLTAAGVLGTMPNVVTNRVNSQLDLRGPSFSVFAEEASGTAALAIGCRALRTGEADTVLVAAVDLSCEPVHEAALRALGLGRHPGDAAVALLLRRRADAEREGAEVLAVVEDAGLGDTAPAVEIRRGGTAGDVPAFDPVDRFGSAHAAEGLVAIAAAALAVRHRALPRPDGPAEPMLRAPIAEVTTTLLGGGTTRVRVRGAAPAAWATGGGYAVHLFGGRDRREVAKAVRSGRRSEPADAGPCRLAVVERPGDTMADRREAAHRWLTGQGGRPPATACHDRPVRGEIAFVYPNGSACHPHMGRGLMLAFPELVDDLRQECGDLARLAEPALAGRPANPVQKNLATTVLADLHTRLTCDRLGIRPDAMLGYSSGEGSGMTALRVWSDIPAFFTELATTECYTGGLIGEQRTARRAWRRLGLPDDRWVNLLVAASPEQARAALQHEPAAYLLAVNTPGLCVIGGAAGACDRVVQRLGRAVTVLPLDYDIAAHSPVLNEAGAELRRLYRRPLAADLSAVRFYTGTTGTAYVPTSESMADAVANVTLEPIDFAATVRAAWEDGVRVFVEHGPRNLCSGWISAILRGRDHLAVALDGHGEDSVAALVTALAELTAAGVCADPGPVLDRLAPTPASAGEPTRSLVTPAHPPLVAGSLARPPFTPPAAGGAATVAREPDTHRPGDRGAEARPGNAGPRRPGPFLVRAQLERLATGQVSAVLGDEFADIDRRKRHTRLPAPPMLLVDRVLDIDAEPGSGETGTIRSETDIRRDAWYVDGCGRMPVGPLLEAGQAYLLLLTWLGADRYATGDHVHRFLGCDITFHGSPPPVGTTIRYHTTIDRHVEHDGMHLFFFHGRCDADGEPVLVVDNSQAGYFTDDEISTSEGVIWRPDGLPPPPGRWSAPPAATKTSFGFAEVRAFAEGRPDLCFGKGWETTRAHLRTPRTGSGRMQLLHRVPVFDPAGGPWQRGYLRAEFDCSPQEWFFACHFTDDPCMPGTLMFDACLQAMAFHLAGCGHTLDRDGWRFEPVPGETFRLRCRGQVTPRSRLLTYELFVSEIVGGPSPTLFADALCTVDGVKVFHVRRLGLRLAPDWPLTHWSGLAAPATQPPGEPRPPEHLGGLLGHDDKSSADHDGPGRGYPELLISAWGSPARRDGSPSIRLPGPPYLFTSRIRDVAPTSGDVGSAALAEYTVPADAWFWAEGGGTAPLAVLTEIAVQPCSWLLGHLGLPQDAGPGTRLRNLGGSLTVHRPLHPSDDVVRTTARLTGVADRGGTTVCAFDVVCHVGDEPLLTLRTTTGLLPGGDTSWPSAASGSEPAPDPRGTRIDLSTRPRHLFGGRPRLPGSMLLMIDRVTGWWPGGGTAGLGRVLAEKDLDPGHWAFKAHVFQDPVLPGSLALEAVSQLLQFSLLDRRTAGERGTRFETPVAGRELTWTHHGEIPPTGNRLVLDLDITGTSTDDTGRRAAADARLYVGPACVCQVRGVEVRMSLAKAATAGRTSRNGGTSR